MTQARFYSRTRLRNHLPAHLHTPVDALSHLIQHARHAYYAGEPIMSDYDYDVIERLLQRLDPEHPTLSEVGV